MRSSLPLQLLNIDCILYICQDITTSARKRRSLDYEEEEEAATAAVILTAETMAFWPDF